MNTSEQVDVVIVGAGPVGVTAANLLGQLGVSVLIIDKAADILTIPRAIGLGDEGARVLQATGLLDTIEPDLLDIETLRFMSPARGELFSLGVRTRRNGHPILRTFHQPTLERRLRAGLERYPAVELAVQTECMRLQQLESGVRVGLQSGGTKRSVECRFLLGCDGARSFVRRSLGIDMRGMTYGDAWLVVDAVRDPTPGPDMHFLCDPRRPGVTMPSPNGGRRWEFMLMPGDTRESIASPASLQRLLAPWGDVARMELDRVAVYTFHSRTAERLQQGDVYLLGDAAHLTPPFAGQGLMAGLRDAANIAWKIASVLRGSAPKTLVDTYEQERLPNVRQMVSLARLMGLVVMPTSDIVAGVRDLAFRAIAHMPGVRSAAREVRFKPGAVIKRGVLRRCRSRGRGRVGALFPQFALRSTNGDARPSDDFRRSRWALLGIDSVATDHLTTRQCDRFGALGAIMNIRSGRPVERSYQPDTVRAVAAAEPLPDALRTDQFYVVRPDNHIYAACDPDALEGVVDDLFDTMRCA